MDRESPWIQRTVTYLAVFLGAYDILSLGGFFEYLSIYVSAITYRGINLAGLITLSYLLLPAKGGSKRLFWYDIGLLLAGLASALYITIQPERVLFATENPGTVTTLEIVLFLLLVASILEAGRRCGGMGLLVTSVFFFSVVFLGDYYPGPFYARTLSLKSITAQMYLCLGDNSIFGLLAQLTATIMIAFMLFSGFLQVSGAGEFFTKLGLSLAGKYRGGPAKIAIVASALMGTISGSGVANVVTTGPFTIPLMKKVGYKPAFAAAVEAVASNGGQITPPVMGAVAFIIPRMIGVTYWDVCVAAFLPALLYYSALFFMIDFEAIKRGLLGMPKGEVPSLKTTLKEGWFYLVPIFILIFLIVERTFSVERACMFSIVSMVLVCFFGGRRNWFTPSKIFQGVDTGVRTLVSVSGAMYTAGIIIASISMTGVALNFTRIITQFAGESTLLMLILAALSCFILGIGLSSIPCYIVTAILVGPPLAKAGIPPIAAHLFFFYWGVSSFITPPVAEAALAAAGIAGSNFWETGWLACKLGIVSYIVPFFFVYNPALLLRGRIDVVIMAVITAMIGCYILASGVIGYFLKNLGWPSRMLLIVFGLLTIYPGWETDMVGLIGAGIVGFIQWLRTNAARRPVG